MNAFAPLLASLRTAPTGVLSAQGMLSATALAERIERYADVLAAAGLRCVASRLDNGPEWLALDLALRRLDAVHVPLPTFFSAEQTAHALRSSGAQAVVVAAGDDGRNDPRNHPPPGVDAGAGRAFVDGLRLWPTAHSARALPASTACITYTSGTTAQAKGVCLDAASLLTVAGSLHAATRPLAPRRHLCLMPLSTLLENVAGVYAALLSDAEIAVPTLAEIGYSGAAGLDVPTLLRCLHRYQPESAILFPQLLLALVTAAEHGHALPRSLRFLAVGGGRVGERLIARAAAVGLPVYEGYGLTECASVVCLNRPGAVRAGSVGRALMHARVSVRDGELIVDGVRHLGYLDGEGEASIAQIGLQGSAQTNVQTGAQTGAIATGDLGRIDDEGFVHIDGRRKHMFITAYGRNVSPEWVESELLQHPLFAQAMICGEARPHNVAVLWPRIADADDARIRRALADVNRGLPDYAQIGDYVRAERPFAIENGLLTANGRLRRDAIARRYADAIAARYAGAHTLLSHELPHETAV